MTELPADARPLRESEVTPELSLVAKHIDVDVADYPMGSVTDLGAGVVARVEVHTWVGATGEQRPEGIRGVTLWHVGPHAAIVAPAVLERVEGIDLSNDQRGADLAKVAASGRSFVFVKATEGVTYADKSFHEHWERAGDAGLLRGAYHFFRASRSSTDQVNHFLDVVANVAVAHGSPELPLVLDVEVLDGVDPAGCAAAVARAVETVAAFGKRPLIYTMPSFFDALPSAALDHLAEAADLWVAHWGVVTPRVPKAWGGWSFWQYSATATVPGVAGRMDVNVFAGSLEQLRSGAPPMPPAAPPLDLSTLVGVQHALNVLGAFPPLAEDGIDGVATRAALLAFQGQHGLIADGLVGWATRAALRAALARKGV